MTKDEIKSAPPAPGHKRIRPEGITRNQWKKQKRVQKITGFWPALFDINNPKPLKINIIQDMIKDIQARALDMGAGSVRAALSTYTGHSKYIRCVAAGGPRYDLNGEPCGEVTEAAVQHATERLRAFRADRHRVNASIGGEDGGQEGESAKNG
ncbi:prop effector [Salmonella enterica]|nr:prop effector [Salmonella enterica]EHD2122859.1 prop effector [Salmonella enterica]